MRIDCQVDDAVLTTLYSNNPYYNYNYQVPNPPPPVSVGEKLLKLFRDAESERANVFISTIRQFNTEFNEAQLSRSQDDRRLAEDFRTFLVGIQTTFTNSRGRYTKLFERIELERDNAFDAKLEEMAKLAKEADDHRKDDFESALEGFKKYAEVAMKVRFELFEQGRKERVGMVDALVHSVRERCVEILEGETEAYNAVQRERREKILRYVRHSIVFLWIPSNNFVLISGFGERHTSEHLGGGCRSGALLSCYVDTPKSQVLDRRYSTL